MPAPYTIEETASASGLSVKFIRRLKGALPKLFAKHTERGPANALLFDEDILETLKRTGELRSRGRTLQQIRDELAALAKAEEGSASQEGKQDERREAPSGALPAFAAPEDPWEGLTIPENSGQTASTSSPASDLANAALERENTLLRSQVNLLQHLLRKAEERFDRLLPAGQAPTTPVGGFKENMKSQLILWLVEAVVVTSFAAGFIFLIWFFAQKVFAT